jgi:formiminotetrahydrofolate cyclodeaminase
MDVPPEDAAMPDYLGLPLGRFLDLVASGEPAPGGGAAAAVAIALAAGLSGMAARFSAEQLADAPDLADRADALRQEVAPLARADAEAYGRVLEAYRLPREPDPGTRRRSIREALSGAADVPLAVAENGAEVAGIAARLAKEGNPNLKGDAIAAVVLAGAGVRAAAMLVEINLSIGEVDDERLVRVSELVAKVARAAQQTEDGVG